MQAGSFRILGIDPGSSVVGYACIERPPHVCHHPKEMKIIEVGVLRANGKLSHSERLGVLHEQLYDVMKPLGPNACVMERAFSGRNAFTALRLGEARGALIAAVRGHGVPIHEFAPAHAKKIIAGNGAATKEQVAMVLGMVWRFERGGLPLDATDALSIALAFGMEHATRVASAAKLPKMSKKVPHQLSSERL